MEQNYPELWMSALALAGGLSMLFAGGEMLVTGASRLALRWGMSTMLVGLTVVAFGTSIPELFVSLTATLQGYNEIMIGNVIGSNIANVGLVLAFAALLVPLRVHLSLLKTELYLLLAVSLCVAGVAWAGFFFRTVGVLFVAGLILYTFISYRKARNNRNKDHDSEMFGKDHSYPVLIGMVAAGLLFLALGADFFIDGAADVALHFGVSELVVGLTLAAVGTSLPELASSISAVRRNEGDLLIGNVIGSNLFNLMMVFGTTAALAPFPFSQGLLGRDLPIMIFFSAILVPILYVWKGISRWHGALLLALYGAYLLMLV